MSFEQLNIRLPVGLKSQIPPGNLTKWIAEAIREKIARDATKPEPPKIEEVEL